MSQGQGVESVGAILTEVEPLDISYYQHLVL